MPHEYMPIWPGTMGFSVSFSPVRELWIRIVGRRSFMRSQSLSGRAQRMGMVRPQSAPAAHEPCRAAWLSAVAQALARSRGR